MGNYLSSDTPAKSLLENQPDDIIRQICSFLDVKDMFNLRETSKQFNKVTNFITHITIPGQDYKLKNNYNQKQTNIIYQIIKDAHLAESTTISTINISDYYIKEESIIEISNHLPKNLKNLRLHNTGLTLNGLDAVMTNLPTSLETLNMSYNTFGDMGINSIVKHFSRLSNLTKLAINGINMTSVGYELLIRMKKNNKHIKSTYTQDNYY